MATAVSIVNLRKRKNFRDRVLSSRDMEKVRVVEPSGPDCIAAGHPQAPQFRNPPHIITKFCRGLKALSFSNIRRVLESSPKPRQASCHSEATVLDQAHHIASHSIISDPCRKAAIYPPYSQQKPSSLSHASEPLQSLPSHRRCIIRKPQSHEDGTIIHRPRSRLHLRPGVFSSSFDGSSAQIGSHMHSSSEYHFHDSSGSAPGTLSTGATSLFPDSLAGSRKNSSTPRGSHGTAVQKDAYSSDPAENPLDWEPVDISPSVKTIERAAATKTYLESSFYALYKKQETPRELRRKVVLALTAPENREATIEWLRVLEGNYLRQSRRVLHLEDFDVIRVLGKGSFGVVQLVKWRGDTPRSEDLVEDAMPKATEMVQDCGQLYAMKVIRKSEMLKSSQEGHLKAERDFLIASRCSQWVVQLTAAFEDYGNLYLVMEYMVGGDFLGLLIRADVFDEHVARHYIAEMILCVEEAHKMNWIHRDIKPDNFLISASGHLKISDFGLAFNGHWEHNQAYWHESRHDLIKKFDISVTGDELDVTTLNQQEVVDKLAHTMHPNHAEQKPPKHRPTQDTRKPLNFLQRRRRRQFARSVVGTSQYMAPEVIQGNGYDGRCDWWSIGIILYECLYGVTPFCADDRETTKALILQHQENHFRCPDGPRQVHPRNGSPYYLPPVSDAAQDLIHRLLDKVEQRLSCGTYTLNNLSEADRVNYGITDLPRPKFVFPNDAVDIKAHPYFYGFDWATVHLQTPFFRPHLKPTSSVAKYFEKEEQIMSGFSPNDSDIYPSTSTDVANASSKSEKSLSHPSPVATTAAAGTKRFLPRRNQADGGIRKQGTKIRNFTVLRARPRRETQRPRDILLRDPRYAKTVMDVRKRTAFMGYNYLRHPIDHMLVEGIM